MRIKVIILSCLVGAAVVCVSYEASLARSESKAEKAASGIGKVGVVSVQKIFKDCKRSVRYREEAIAERSGIEAELDKLAKEIEAGKAGLKTLKAGSSEHLEHVREVLKKQGSYEAQREFYKQQVVLKEQRIIERLYEDILRESCEVAEEKGLGLVFERSEPELPASNSSDLTLTISTHKLLYSGGCLDITEEVMARLDAEGSEKLKTKNAKP